MFFDCQFYFLEKCWKKFLIAKIWDDIKNWIVFFHNWNISKIFIAGMPSHYKNASYHQSYHETSAKNKIFALFSFKQFISDYIYTNVEELSN